MSAAQEKVFDALGNPTRRQIVRLLEGGPMPVGEIASHLPVSRPAVSKHLKILSEASLVTHESSGNQNLFRIDKVGFDQGRAWLDSFWDDALARFALVAENLPEQEENGGDHE